MRCYAHARKLLTDLQSGLHEHADVEKGNIKQPLTSNDSDHKSSKKKKSLVPLPKVPIPFLKKKKKSKKGVWKEA
jgi:hypothetical protein